VLLFFHLIL
jgi:hypothetical protein